MTICEPKWTFAFILPRSARGSERSCLRPAGKLHLKLVLWSEWLISHLEAMKVNESGKETASPLLRVHRRLSRLPPANRFPEKVSKSRRIQNGSQCPFSLATSARTSKSQIPRPSFPLCNAASCFPSLSYCCKWVWVLVCAACSLGMNGRV